MQWRDESRTTRSARRQRGWHISMILGGRVTVASTGSHPSLSLFQRKVLLSPFPRCTLPSFPAPGPALVDTELTEVIASVEAPWAWLCCVCLTHLRCCPISHVPLVPGYAAAIPTHDLLAVSSHDINLRYVQAVLPRLSVNIRCF